MDSVDIEVLRTAEAWRKQGRPVALGTIVKTCGGTLQLVLEPLTDHSRIAELLDRISQQQLVKRRLEMDSGRATLEPGRWQDVLEFDGSVLSAVHGPRWRLVLIGAGQLTRYLAAVPINRGMPDDIVRELELDGHSALVALTHDPKLDDLALMEGLKSAAFYVGAIGSKKNNDARRERLKEFDVSADEIARLRGPVGLYLGSKTPPEIAVAILAEMTAVRHGVSEPTWAAKPERRFDPSACEVKTTT